MCNHEIFLLGPDHAKLASHVLQMVFLGDGGYRWPFAHFPTTEATATDLYMLFWDAVKHLNDWGFTVSTSTVVQWGTIHGIGKSTVQTGEKLTIVRDFKNQF